MADISKLSRLIGGVQRQVDLSTNTLVVDQVKVGGPSGTNLTKTILDNLITLQNGSDAGSLHNHDGRYFTETELGSTTGGSAGSTRIGDDNSYTNFSNGTGTVKGALTAIDAALAAAAGTSFSDAEFDVHNSGDPTKVMMFDISAVATATTRTISMPDEDVNLGLISSAIQSSEKGANNGVATLDAGGKIPVSQLPNAVMTYEGTWDASTNTPTLADGVGNAGMVYLTTVGGTVDFGSGNITFAPGDWVVYNGAEWEKAINSNAVVSVNGQTGVVSLDTDDIPEGSALYFTDARARTAVITATISDGDTTHAPSADAVFDALALKQDADPALDEAITFFENTDISGAEAEQLTDGSNADSLHTHSLLIGNKIAGEAFAAALWAVRYAKAADAGFVAGRVYKADNDASSADDFYVIGLARPAGSLSAADPINVVKSGEITATGHGFTVGAPLFLDAGGNVTETAPTADNTAVVRVGMVIDANTIEVQIQVMGVN